jgi:FtsP/CotA-like multicopper oxidase with cupredoxin domain
MLLPLSVATLARKTLYPFVNPPTELFDATFLPKNNVDIKVTPIASADGTQIWKITHNGVDTHPLHWHLYDLQVLNRVTWDNIVSPPDPHGTRLEGHPADKPARGHVCGHQADYPAAAVRTA